MAGWCDRSAGVDVKNDPKPYDAAAEYFGERAAIREYDGGLDRKEAERLAEIDLAAWLEDAFPLGLPEGFM